MNDQILHSKTGGDKHVSRGLTRSSILRAGAEHFR